MLLSVNAGSSSIKVTVFRTQDLSDYSDTFSIEDMQLSGDSLSQALEHIQTWLRDELSIHPGNIKAVGHRVVHGGPRYDSATPVTDDLLSYLTDITPLAPNHMPGVLAAMYAFLRAFPDAFQVACFDTGFFHDVPQVAKTLPIPMPLQRESGIHRYGFHGLSYQSLLASFWEHEGETAYRGRVIMAHLGNGASVAACKDGAPVDMSMGFTPVSGIMMSTRSGDLEPGVITYLQNDKGFTTEVVNDIVTFKSGLLGVSETTGDMHTLLSLQHEDPRAQLAIELFCYKVKKTIGAYAAVLGGVDSIIFSGGIGERSAEIRARICNGLEFLGVVIDEARNQAGARLISSDSSGTGVHVISAHEDYAIAKQTIECMQKEQS